MNMDHKEYYSCPMHPEVRQDKPVFKGILLEPAVAAVLMSASTVIVAVNAVLLRKRVL